jgi:pimeloyl-ACP methyl ester carboxylesterase
MRETAHRFGSHGGLVGVLAEPAAARDGVPAAVFANVGLNHRVGPSRSWVECARALAVTGYPSLRFDLSGLGDSEPRRDVRSDTERAVLDLTEALDFLEARGVARRFVLIANCSGVDSQHVVACRDPRVAGAVYLDGYAYRNEGYTWRRALGKWFQPSRWRRFLRHARDSAAAARAGTEDAVWQRDLPSRAEFAAALRALVERGVRLLFIYTGGMDLHYNHRGQFHDTFGYRGEVDVEYYPRFDHLLSLAAERRAFNARVCDFMRRAFPSGDGG